MIIKLSFPIILNESVCKKIDGQTKWMYGLNKMVTFCKNIILFGINSVQIFKKKLDSEPLHNKKNFEKQNKILL